MMKKSTRLYLQQHGAWLAVTVLVLAGTIILGYILFHEEEEPTSDVRVEEVYFVQTHQDELETKMNIIVFVTNDGEAELSDIKIRAFAVETDSNLARDEAVKIITSVEGDSTVEGTLTITLPNNDSYRVELLVFKEGKLTIRGSGTVNLVGVGGATPYKTARGGGTGDDSTYPPDASMWIAKDSSNICLVIIVLLVTAAIIAGIVFFVVRSGKNDKAKGAESGSARQGYDVKNMSTWMDGMRYPCTVCGGPVPHGSRQCPNCGISFYQSASYDHIGENPAMEDAEVAALLGDEDDADAEAVDEAKPRPLAVRKKIVHKEQAEDADTEGDDA